MIQYQPLSQNNFPEFDALLTRLMDHITQENKNLKNYTAEEIQKSNTLKGALAETYRETVRKMTQDKSWPQIKESFADAFEEKILRFDELMTMNESIIRGIQKARGQVVDLITQLIDKQQNPKTQTYTQKGYHKIASKRKTAIPYSMNYSL